jgi:hypothetical protein
MQSKDVPMEQTHQFSFCVSFAISSSVPASSGNSEHMPAWLGQSLNGASCYLLKPQARKQRGKSGIRPPGSLCGQLHLRRSLMLKTPDALELVRRCVLRSNGGEEDRPEMAESTFAKGVRISWAWDMVTLEAWSGDTVLCYGREVTCVDGVNVGGLVL